MNPRKPLIFLSGMIAMSICNMLQKTIAGVEGSSWWIAVPLALTGLFVSVALYRQEL